jgi:hypothetical protein
VKNFMHPEKHTMATISPYPDEIRPFMEWTMKNVKRFLWAEGHCYSEKYWLGGISDTGYEHNDGHFGILDFKSAKAAYPEHFWQMGGYHIQISETGIFDSEGNQLLVPPGSLSRFDKYGVWPFGGNNITEPQWYENPALAREVFLAALLIYKATPQNN